MSHFTRIRTQIKNKEILIQSLKEMGYYVRENVFIDGYKGKKKVDIAAKQKNSFSIGFALSSEGSYEIVADWWGVEGVSEEGFSAGLKQKIKEIQSRIKRRYALRAVLEKTREQGFNLVEEKHEKDGTIRIVVRKWD